MGENIAELSHMSSLFNNVHLTQQNFLPQCFSQKTFIRQAHKNPMQTVPVITAQERKKNLPVCKHSTLNALP